MVAPVDRDDDPTDAQLLARVRTGDEGAYAQLWERHERAARRFACTITRPSNVDDLVSESFYRALRTIKKGHGPDGPFRPYLFSIMRRYLIDNWRSYDQRIILTGDHTDLDRASAPSAEELVARTVDQQAALQAWLSLPENSRTLLWHMVIEGEPPSQVAPLLGTTSNGASSRSVRAKERLRQAFLNQYTSKADNEMCHRTRTRLGGYIRAALSMRDRGEVDNHLAGCTACRSAVDEVRDVNLTLRAVAVPALLSGTLLAGKYLAVASTVFG